MDNNDPINELLLLEDFILEALSKTEKEPMTKQMLIEIIKRIRTTRDSLSDKDVERMLG